MVLLSMRRYSLWLILVVLFTISLLLHSHEVIFYHTKNIHQVDAFRTIAISTFSLSYQSSSSSSVPSNTTIQRRQHHHYQFWKPHYFRASHRKGTLLWRQQDDTIKNREKVKVDKTLSTATTSDDDDADAKVVDITLKSSGISYNKFVVILSAFGLLSTCIIGAITGIIPGYYSNNIDSSTHTTLLVSTLGRDIGSTVVTGILGYGFVQIITYLTVTKEYIVSRDARKIIHTLSAPLFILFWPLFATNTSSSSRFFAAIVPILNGIRLYIASQSTTVSTNDNDNKNPDVATSSESALAQAVSRSGDSREALGGPFIYVCMLATCILCFWTTTPHGIIAMSTLAAGDGMADIIGRRYGRNNPWPYNTSKSIVGSLAFVLASTITSLLLILWIQYTGSGLLTLSSSYTTMDIAIKILIISSVVAIVETIPWLGDDNYTVPISAAILSMLLFS